MISVGEFVEEGLDVLPVDGDDQDGEESDKRDEENRANGVAHTD